MLTWIFEQLVGDLPNWIWPAVAGSGLAMYFFAGILSHIPTFKPYTFFIKPVGLLITFAGIFLFGGSGVTAIYKEQAEELKQQLAVAKQASTDANAALDKKSANQAKIVHDVQIVYKERIKEVEKKIDADCKMDPEAIGILNSSAKNPFKTGAVTVTGESK